MCVCARVIGTLRTVLYPYWVITGILLYFVRKGRIPKVQDNCRVKVVVLYALHSVSNPCGLYNRANGTYMPINNSSKNNSHEQNRLLTTFFFPHNNQRFIRITIYPIIKESGQILIIMVLQLYTYYYYYWALLLHVDTCCPKSEPK